MTKLVWAQMQNRPRVTSSPSLEVEFHGSLRAQATWGAFSSVTPMTPEQIWALKRKLSFMVGLGLNQHEAHLVQSRPRHPSKLEPRKLVHAFLSFLTSSFTLTLPKLTKAPEPKPDRNTGTEHNHEKKSVTLII